MKYLFQIKPVLVPVEVRVGDGPVKELWRTKGSAGSGVFAIAGAKDTQESLPPIDFPAFLPLNVYILNRAP